MSPEERKNLTPVEELKTEEKKQNEALQQEKDSISEETQIDLNVLGKDTETTQTKEYTTNASNTLKAHIETNKYEALPLQTYNEIIKWTPLEEKINKVLSHPDFNNAEKYPEMQGKSPEQRAEYIFRKINTTLSKFCARRFGIDAADQVPEYLHKVIVPAIEWFLMDLLKHNQQSNNISFFSEISNINLDTLTQGFNSIKGIVEKFTLTYQQGKKLLLILDFLSLPHNKHHLNKLDNPYDFYQKVMENQIWWQENLDIKNLTFEQFWLLKDQTDEEKNQALLDGQKQLKESIWSIQMVDSPETVKQLLWALKKSDIYLEQTDKLLNTLLDSMDKFKGVDSSLQSIFGVNLFKEIQSSKFLRWVANFFLGLLWFSGGVDGLEKTWRKRTLDRKLDAAKKNFITDTFKAYFDNKQIKSDTIQTCLSHYQIKPEEEFHQKFNIDPITLQEQIIDNISNTHHINPQVVKSLKFQNFNGASRVQEVKDSEWKTTLQLKADFFNDEKTKESFVQAYLATSMQNISWNKKFLKSIQDSDDIAFALIAWVSLEPQDVINGMQAWAIHPNEFYETPENSKLDAAQRNPDTTTPPLWLNIDTLKTSPLTDDEKTKYEQSKEKLKSFESYIQEASQKYWIPSEIIKWIITQESWWNPNAWSWAGARGLMQLMPTTAKAMGITHITDPKENIFGGTKYFKQMYDQFNDLELALAAYNAWPENVKNAGNSVPKFTETQAYVKSVPKYIKEYSLEKA